MLSIVIPYYKFTFFEAALESLANQTDKRFKVYIGDDASPENPIQILEKYKEKLEFKYYRFETNLGGISLVKQWERCIALSEKEEWLMILGDDDVLGENVVEEFYKQYEKFKIELNVVRFSSCFIDEKGNQTSKQYIFPKIESTVESFLNHFLELSRSSMSEHIFSRKSYNQNGFVNYPLAWYSDDKAWLDFSECSAIFSINEACVFVRISGENISGKTDNRQLKLISGWQFCKDIIAQKFKFFSASQKKTFLFRYGILQIEFDNILVKQTFFIWIQFVKIGSFYDSFRYLRRIFKALK